MAPERTIRWRSGKQSSRTGKVCKKTTSNVSAAATEPPPENPSDVNALRKARLEHLDKPPEERRQKMKYVGEIVAKSPATRKDVELVQKASEVRRRRKITTAGSKHSHRKVRVAVPKITEPNESEFVYPRARDTEADDDNELKTPLAEDVPDERHAPERSKTQRKTAVEEKREQGERQERRRPQRRQSEPLRRRNSHGVDDCASVQRYDTAHLTILPALTIPDHPILETALMRHCQRVSLTSKTNLGLH
jgi:hypothetical protein